MPTKNRHAAAPQALEIGQRKAAKRIPPRGLAAPASPCKDTLCESSLGPRGPGGRGLMLACHRHIAAQHRHTNRLADETSPYLLQHAHNPVDWFPWGEAALSKARDEDKLIFLSIGYSSCHWCHVMEHESFSDDEIAKYMNDHFVCIKVDREERPDIDTIYMMAVQLLTQRGGWPLSVFLTPDGSPFFGGTYFPGAGRRSSRRDRISDSSQEHQSRVEQRTGQRQSTSRSCRGRGEKKPARRSRPASARNVNATRAALGERNGQPLRCRTRRVRLQPQQPEDPQVPSGSLVVVAVASR